MRTRDRIKDMTMLIPVGKWTTEDHIVPIVRYKGKEVNDLFIVIKRASDSFVTIDLPHGEMIVLGEDLIKAVKEALA